MDSLELGSGDSMDQQATPTRSACWRGGGEGRGFGSALWPLLLALRDGERSQRALFTHRDLGFRAGRVGQRVSPSPPLFPADGDVHGMPLESAGSPLSQVALVSTMYFKSTWQKKFSFMDTQMLPFTTAEGSTLKVPTMHHTAEVNYGNCPWSRFALLYNMEQVYLFNFHSYHTKMCYFPSLEKSQKKSHQTKRPPGWLNWLLIIPGNSETDPGFKMGPKIPTVHDPSLTDQHLPALHNELVSYSKQPKGTEITCRRKGTGETGGTLVYKVLCNSRELVK